jgi:hypothetical protein
MLLPKGKASEFLLIYGVNVLTFDPNRKDHNLEAAVGAASNNIRTMLAAVPSVKTEIPEELEVPILERLHLLSERQREILASIEESGECSRQDLSRRFSQYSEGELHYRLEQLRFFMFITATKGRNKADSRKDRYALRDSYRKVYNALRARIPMPSPPPPPGFR